MAGHAASAGSVPSATVCPYSSNEFWFGGDAADKGRGNEMISNRTPPRTRHNDIRWNPATKEWFCAKCGRASQQAGKQGACLELERYKCELPFVNPEISLGWHGRSKR